MLWQLANELYMWLMDKESVAKKVNLVIYIGVIVCAIYWRHFHTKQYNMHIFTVSL